MRSRPYRLIYSDLIAKVTKVTRSPHLCPKRWYCHYCRQWGHHRSGWKPRRWRTSASLDFQKYPSACTACPRCRGTRRTRVPFRRTRSGSVPADATPRRPPCRRSTVINDSLVIHWPTPFRFCRLNASKVCILAVASPLCCSLALAESGLMWTQDSESIQW